MKSLKYILSLSLVVFFAASCDEGFEELNTNPNDPVAVPSGLLIADVARSATNNLYSTFVGGDMGACWSQQWGKVQYNDEERYDPRESVIESTWKNIYEDVISDAHSMHTLAVAEENANMQGVALTLKAYGFHVLTDLYGDIPYSEAIKATEGIFKPAYDNQEAVYTGILATLDEAITLLGTSGDINSSSDLVYGGDAMMWKKFASSLKFRCLMRISAKKDVSADLQALVNAGNLFSSNDEEASITYLSNDPNANPIYETIVFGNRTEFRIGEVIVNLLEDRNDPRLAVYAQPNTEGNYVGKPAGYLALPSDTWNVNTTSAIGTKYLEAEAPGYFMSYPELLFLMAEAAQKGYISGSANDYYLAGIEASFAANGISADYADYVGQATIPLASGTELEQIATQNYLALFCQGVEAWTEWRRTGFPALTPAVDNSLPDPNMMPVRYTYPTIEESVNKDSYNAAVANQGANALTTKVWWMN